MRRLHACATAAIAAFATLATASPAIAAGGDSPAISGVIAPKTADKPPVVRVNQTANSLLAFALGGSGLG